MGPSTQETTGQITPGNVTGGGVHERLSRYGEIETVDTLST